MLYLRINIPILYMVCCDNQDIRKLDKNNKICLNYQLLTKNQIIAVII